MINVIAVNAGIETVRDISSRLWPGDALGEIFTVRQLGHEWTRVRGEHSDICDLLGQIKGDGIKVR